MKVSNMNNVRVIKSLMKSRIEGSEMFGRIVWGDLPDNCSAEDLKKFQGSGYEITINMAIEVKSGSSRSGFKVQKTIIGVKYD